MANYCNYEIHVKGTKKAALLLANMLPVMDGISIEDEYGSNAKYTVIVCGNCKWSLDHGCEEKSDVNINLKKITLADIEDGFGDEYWGLTLRQKSELLGVEIQARSWSDESEFDQFEHYIKGNCVKQISIDYTDDNEFDWDKLEYC